jgi:hypothetical protein
MYRERSFRLLGCRLLVRIMCQSRQRKPGPSRVIGHGELNEGDPGLFKLSCGAVVVDSSQRAAKQIVAPCGNGRSIRARGCGGELLGVGEGLLGPSASQFELYQQSAQLGRRERVRHQEVQAPAYQPFRNLKLPLNRADRRENPDHCSVLLVARDEPLGLSNPALRYTQLPKQGERLGVQLRLDERADR